MNKNDLVSSVAAHASLSKADAGRAVDAVFAPIEEALTGDEVRIVGFGSFSVAHRAALLVVTRTGEAIQIAASKQLNSRQALH